MKKDKIEIELPILPGSISIAKAKCGTKTCRCHQDEKFLHGPYYRWTGIINGKRTTRTIDKETAKECERRIKNYRKLKDKIDEIIKDSLESAPWSPHD
jgi:hypothetical protein